MCGLVGIVSKRPNFGFSQDEINVFKTLLHLDALRGEDSTGVFGVNNNSNVYIAKSAEISGTFLMTDEYKTIERKMYSEGFAFIGHNRKATRGNITDENAHPFYVNDEVVLVHNGTWYGDHKHIADTEVDSHAFAHAIQAVQPSDVDEAFAKVNAAYATIWYDVRDQSINFARNTQRPLYYLSTGTAWVICSEKEMIEFAIKRVKLTVPNDAPFFLLKEQMHNKIELNNGSPNITTTEIPVYKHVNTSSHKPAEVTPTAANDKWDRNAFANAWHELNNELIDDVASQTKGNVDSFRPALPAPSKQETTKETSKAVPSFTEIAKVIINDMPDNVYSFLSDRNYHKNKHNFPVASVCTFRGRNIAQLSNKDYIIYGPIDGDDSMVGASIFKESELDQIISTEPRASLNITGTVDCIGYKRIVEDVQSDWQGFGFVIIENAKVANEAAHPSC